MSETPPKTVVIIGAGIAGLATAFELLDLERQGKTPPLDLRILEASDRAGGNIRTENDSSYVCEWGPEGFLDSVPETLGLARRVGLENKIVRSRKEADNRYIYRAGKLRAVPLKPPAFLFSDMLPLIPRLRVMCEPLVRGKRDDSDETVFDFAARRIGKGAASALVDAMVSGVYAGDAKRLSLPAAFPKMRAMEKNHGSLFRAMIAKMKEAKRTGKSVGGPSGPKGKLTSFDGGMETFIQGLVDAVGPDRIRYETSAADVKKTSDAWRVVTEKGEEIAAEAVVVSAPAPIAKVFLRNLSSKVSDNLARIPFASIVVVAQGFKKSQVGHPLGGFGFLIPRAEKLKSLGVLWTSSAFPGRAPEGCCLMRTMIGGATFPEAVDMADDEIVEMTRREISPILGINGEPDWTRVFRFRNGIAQYNIGHLETLSEIEKELSAFPGLFLTGTSYRGIAINSACEAGPKAAKEIAQRLTTPGSSRDQVF